MEKIRRHIVFYGSVQGVGFRYRAYYAAQACGVSGWVRNCYDGSVEMEAEGTEKAIDDMILAIEKGTYVREEPPPPRRPRLRDTLRPQLSVRQRDFQQHMILTELFMCDII